MKILIPMAGEGSRFLKEGYKLPKPLVDVKGKPMIQCVVENLCFNAEYIFLVRKEHLDKYSYLQDVLRKITNNKFSIITVESLTEGAACTALLAKDLINTDEDLLIANSDQILEYNYIDFLSIKQNQDYDGIVFAFNATDSKWSFVKTDFKGYVIEVAEKKPISDIATCGVYWYKHGREFVKCAESMISKNLRVNNEFYIAPVYNEMIENGKKIVPFFVHKMHGIGTPEDLNNYLRINF